jgi:hypothetical protein
MTPSLTRYGTYTTDHYLVDALGLLQHGFHTYNLFQTIPLMERVSNQSDSVAMCLLCKYIYFHIAIGQHINLWNLLLKAKVISWT